MTVVGGIPYTRNGNRIYNVGHIIKELTNQLLKKKSDIKNFVFDGECMGPGTFEETIGSARTQTEDNSDLRYHIFDMILIEEWNAKKTEPFLARRNRLEHYIHSKRCVTVVESIPSSTATAVTADAYLKLYVNQGYEGAMWKSASGPYEFKRSSYVLKIKSFETHDGEIIAYEKGTGKNANVLGCFTVKLEDGTQVRVGGGYTDAQRKQFWKDRTSLVGKTVEIQYQNKTAKGSLRFPVFVRFRPDKD
jgi:ATP-dependent DNA ligase